MGKKAADGIVEVKLRRAAEPIEVKVAELQNSLAILLKQAE